MNLAAVFKNIASVSLSIAVVFKNVARSPFDFKALTNSTASVFNNLATVSVGLAAWKGSVTSER
jgi:hypothetical protein